jgi:outer membrane protein OmpA-like peptidoglycan-associated protein
MNQKRKNIFLFLCFFMLFPSFCQELICYRGNKNYIWKERTDLRRYDNGKYIGLLSREVSSFIVPVNNDDGYLYDGNFYITQQTKRAGVSVNKGINEAIPSVFKIDDEGNLTILEDNGFPTFRSFPSYPKYKISKGDSWTANAHRSVDPLEKGKPTKIPFIVQYVYAGDTIFNGTEVYILKAQWANRYVQGIYLDEEGDPELLSAKGSHSASIYVSKQTGNALVIRDTVDESFSYADGKIIALKGTISLFTEYPPAVETEKIVPALTQLAELEDAGFEKTQAGLKLTVQNLKFKADSAELLPEEKNRLDRIAEVLRQIPSSKFLIEGHTADVGNPDGQMKLSKERAFSVAEELSRRGIDASRFICKGSGALKPLADNSTREGRTKNRRVEITILE